MIPSETAPLVALDPPLTIVERVRATAFRAAAGYPRLRAGTPLLAILVLAAVLRTWALDVLGFNSDEAVYAGQAASLAGDPATSELFPVFRAHPLLFQTTLSLIYGIGGGDLAARGLVVILGLATVVVVHLIGTALYGRRVGLAAALLLAAMPYHVGVSRLVLLDVPMTFMATTSLYFFVRYCQRRDTRTLLVASAVLGMAILTKETAVLIIGGLISFAVLFPALRPARRPAALAAVVVVATVLVYPLSLRLSGRSSTGQSYLAWQLMRRPNHSALFYLEVVPPAMGFAVVALAALGLWLLRRDNGWREGLLLCWISVPVAFFEIWPTKGFQYLIMIAPLVAVLAARTVMMVPLPTLLAARPGTWLIRVGVLTAVLASLLPANLRIVDPTPTTTFLAGSGGLPAGRETGRWISENLPLGARLMTIGPSTANVVRFYGHRPAVGLSVSPNPLHRNPSYEPIDNPDRELREGTIQYAVWDAFTASRSPFFADRLLRYVTKYRGIAVHTETIRIRAADGSKIEKPAMIVYEVRR